MESPVKTIVCPNCGANATNHHNCEYCGSLLVRFVSNHIAIDKDSYGDDAFVFPGLDAALRNNLILQETSDDDMTVWTDFIANGNELDIQIVPSINATLGLDAENPFKSAKKPSLAVKIPYLINSPNEESAIRSRHDLSVFKSMDIYPLFTEIGFQYGLYYLIDFGEDIEMASKMISNILRKVYGCSNTSFIDYNTEITNKKDVVVNVGDNVTTSKTLVIILSAIFIAAAIAAFAFLD